MNNKVLLGFSKRDITPTYSVEMVGYSREDNKSRGVLHPLLAEIALWEKNGERFCFITIDHIGFMYSDANIIRNDVAEKLEVTSDKVMICFSHTHSSANVSFEPEYFETIRKEILAGVCEAETKLKPVKAVWKTAKAAVGQNRRNKDGALDDRLGILKIVDDETEELCLLILRVTAHANILSVDNYLISSDFMGVTRMLLEEKYGCNVMVTQGASGNVSAKYTESCVESLELMANEIFRAVDDCINDMKPEKIETISMHSKSVEFAADVPTMKRAKEISEEAMRENYIDGTEWLKEVDRLIKSNVRVQNQTVEIQYFNINNGCYCGVPNEIMCEIALEVAKESKNENVYFAGYTNGNSGYLPTAKEYDRGGFEVLHSYLIFYIYHGNVMPLNRDTAEKLIRAVVEG